MKSKTGTTIKDIVLKHIVRYEFINGGEEEECVKKLQTYIIHYKYNVSYDLKTKVMQWFDDFKIGKFKRNHLKASSISTGQKPMDLSMPMDFSTDESMNLQSEKTDKLPIILEKRYLQPVAATSDVNRIPQISQEIIIKAEEELNKKHQHKDPDILAPHNFFLNLTDDQLRDWPQPDLKSLFKRSPYLSDIMKKCLSEKRRVLRNRKIAKEKKIVEDQKLAILSEDIQSLEVNNKSKNSEIQCKEDKIAKMLEIITRQTCKKFVFCEVDRKWKLQS